MEQGQAVIPEPGRLRVAILGVALGLLVARTTPGETVVRVDETFDTPGSVAQWVYEGMPGGAVSWEPADGLPAGSLALDHPASVVGNEFAQARLCLRVPSTNEPWRIEADVYVGDQAECALFTRQYLSPDCTGEEFFTPDGADGSFQHGTWDQLLIVTSSGVVPVDIQSLAIKFFANGDTVGVPADRCLLDNLRATGPTFVPIPTLGRPGAAVMILLVLLLGLRMLNRGF